MCPCVCAGATRTTGGRRLSSNALSRVFRCEHGEPNAFVLTEMSVRIHWCTVGPHSPRFVPSLLLLLLLPFSELSIFLITIAGPPTVGRESGFLRKSRNSANTLVALGLPRFTHLVGVTQPVLERCSRNGVIFETPTPRIGIGSEVDLLSKGCAAYSKRRGEELLSLQQRKGISQKNNLSVLLEELPRGNLE